MRPIGLDKAMRILFVCKDHGARSRLAELMARQVFAGEHEVESAGLIAGTLTPLATEALKAVGDPQIASPRTLATLVLGEYDLAVVVGSEREVQAALPANLKRVTWPLMDPLDPPAHPAEMKARLAELRMALDKHLKSLGKMKRRMSA